MDPQLTVPVVLLAGVVSFASPCFLPVVPVFAGYMAGQGSWRESGRAWGQRWAAAGHASTFMAAFAMVFVSLWALVGLVGWVVGDYRDVLRVGGGIVLVLLGLHTASWIRLPFLDRTVRADYHPDTGRSPTVRRSFLLGLAFGAGWTPCIGPVLGGVLGLAVSTPTVGSGVWLLLVFSLGLGIPFVLVSAGVAGVARRLSWFTRHARAVGVVTGLLLVVVGFLMITDLFARLPALAV
ncbi:MAG: cytochrome c biogenesis CcdA family protein [Micrococcales bacterium]|nr:cytochrome c biogenesis CcdA family protein [Micrococcales bacterium]